MISDESIKYFRILKKIFLSYNIQAQCYSLGEYAEEAICIEERDENIPNLRWIVYVGERAQKHNLKEYNDIKNACKDIIRRISENNDIEHGMLKYFDTQASRMERGIKRGRNRHITIVAKTKDRNSEFKSVNPSVSLSTRKSIKHSAKNALASRSTRLKSTKAFVKKFN